jgi:hypothetical protein
MNIWDNTIETKSGAKFSLHYRGLKNRTYSGFLRNCEWPKNCSISIPKTKGMAKFQSIVDQVIDNEDKFNSANTLGRPRYYDILANGVDGLPEENKLYQLRKSNPEFKTYKNSKRMWYYKTMGGNFNMKSIKINHMRLIDSVSFKDLMPFIEDQEVKEVLEALRRQKFEFESEFIGFCDQLIDATEDTLIASYNSYMKSLIGTHKTLMRHRKNGDESMTYYVYVAKEASFAEKALQEASGREGIPHNANVKVVELTMFPESALANAETAKIRHEKLEAIKAYFEQRKADAKAAKKHSRKRRSKKN